MTKKRKGSGDMELFSGRPENTEGRLQREVRTYDFLDEIGIEYKRTDHEPGAVSIMGLMNDKEHAVQLLVDEDVKKGEYIGCHPCVCTSSLKIKTEDIFNKFLPKVGHEPVVVHLVGEE